MDQTSLNVPQRLDTSKQIFYWLLVCGVLIYIMIILGGVTRLTHSGLSMVDWDPIMGIIPPLNQHDWLALFKQYQQFPEYQQVHTTMNLDEFKTIFYFEYSHRVLGRIIGLFFFVPPIYFWLKGLLSRQLLKKVVIIFILGGAQGGLGWYMVQSGLIDEPRVSQYRLTAHLGLATLLYGFIVWLLTELHLNRKSFKQDINSPKSSHIAILLMIAIFLMILSGGMVAGLRAGLIWNTFPLMGESFIPPGLYEMSPIWLSAFEDMTTVQFNHRILAYSIFVFATLLLVRLMINGSNVGIQRTILGLYIALCCQVVLGVTALIFAVPILIGTLHQACGILVFTIAVIMARLTLHIENEHK